MEVPASAWLMGKQSFAPLQRRHSHHPGHKVLSESDCGPKRLVKAFEQVVQRPADFGKSGKSMS